jgi:uncharacterized integral membrane protein
MTYGGPSGVLVMLTKINVLRIVADHFRTLKDYRTNKLSFGDLIVFCALPLLIAGALSWWGKVLSVDTINVLIQAFAILVGLLLNLLVLVFTVIRRETSTAANPNLALQEETKLTVLKQTFANLSYSVLLGLVIALLLLLALRHNSTVVGLATFFIYAGSIHFVLTLLMVLKRVHSLLGREFDGAT